MRHSLPFTPLSSRQLTSAILAMTNQLQSLQELKIKFGETVYVYWVNSSMIAINYYRLGYLLHAHGLHMLILL